MTKRRRSIEDILGGPKPRRSHKGGKGDGGRSANPFRDELYQEQTRMARLKADQMAGRLVPSADVAAAWSEMIVDARQRLLAIPSRLGARLSLPQRTVDAIDDEIRTALKALAANKGEADG